MHKSDFVKFLKSKSNLINIPYWFYLIIFINPIIDALRGDYKEAVIWTVISVAGFIVLYIQWKQQNDSKK